MASIALPLILALALGSCFPVNHFQLTKRYRQDLNRYESMRQEGTSSSSRQSLEYAGQYLDEARKANRRWDNARARLFLEMAESHLDRIVSSPAIPPSLMEIYEAVQPFTPEP